jgi:hypothetical protein
MTDAAKRFSAATPPTVPYPQDQTPYRVGRVAPYQTTVNLPPSAMFIALRHSTSIDDRPPVLISNQDYIKFETETMTSLVTKHGYRHDLAHYDSPGGREMHVISCFIRQKAALFINIDTKKEYLADLNILLDDIDLAQNVTLICIAGTLGGPNRLRELMYPFVHSKHQQLRSTKLFDVTPRSDAEQGLRIFSNEQTVSHERLWS